MAKFAEHFFIDRSSVARLVGENRTLAERIRDFIEDLRVRLVGTEYEKELLRIRQQFDKALKDARIINDGGAEYSFVGTRDDGIEVYETNAKADRTSYKERRTAAEDYIKAEMRGITARFVRNGHYEYADFQEADAKHIVRSKRNSDDKGFKALANIIKAGNLIDLVEGATYSSSLQETGKQTSGHKNVDHWDYLVKTVQIDGRVYDIVVDVKYAYGNNPRHTYSVGLVESKKISPEILPPVSSQQASIVGADGLSVNSIRNSSAKSQYSEQENFSLENNMPVSEGLLEQLPAYRKRLEADGLLPAVTGEKSILDYVSEGLTARLLAKKDGATGNPALDLLRAELEKVAGVERAAAEPKNTPDAGQSTLSTYINADLEDKTERQRKTIREYIAAVNNKIKALAEYYRNNKNGEFRRERFSEVSARQAADIERLTGINVRGYQNGINKNGLDHIERRHGVNGEADSTMADLNDVARIPYIIDNYDEAELVVDSNGNPVASTAYYNSKGYPAPVVKFMKRIDGVVYVAEGIPDSGYRTLWVETAYIGNKKGTSRVLDAEAPSYTSETPHTAVPFENSIRENYPNSQDPLNEIFDDSEQEAEKEAAERYRRQVEDMFGKGGTEIAQVMRDVRSGEEAAQEVKLPPEIAVALSNKGVGYGKDIWRVAEGVSNGDKKIWTWIEHNVLRPLEKAKAAYASDVTDYVAKYSKALQKYGIKIGSAESTATMWLGEGVKEDGTPYTLEQLKKDFPNKWEDIAAFDEVNRTLYEDFIEKINASMQVIYPQVEAKAQKDLAKLRDSLLIEEGHLENLVAKSVGLSGEARQASQRQYAESRKTIKKLNSQIAEYEQKIATGEIYGRKRLARRKDYYHHFAEMLEGFEGIRNILSTSHEIDPRLVGTSEHTKPKSSWAGFMQRRKGGAYTADPVKAMQAYIPAALYKIHIDPVIAQLRGVTKAIVDGTGKTRNANKLIEWLFHYTNSLAGKTNFLGRGAQTLVGRKVSAAVGWLNSRVKSNTVLGNLRSALVQIGNLPNAALYITNPKSWAKGAMQTVAGDLSYKSDFIRERYIDKVTDTLNPKRKPKDFAKWLLTVGDETATRLIWNIAYQDAMRKGESNPTLYADRITRKCVAGRGIGELPLLQQSKVANLVAPFQVEVNNTFEALKETLGGVFKSPKAAGEALYKITGWTVGSWVINSIIEFLTGQRPLPDLADPILEALFAGDDEADDETKLERLLQRLAGEVVSIIPYSAVLASLTMSDETLEKWFGDDNPTRYGTANIGVEAVTDTAEAITDIARTVFRREGKDEALKALETALLQAFNVFLPWGGSQIGRTYEGIKTVVNGADYSETGATRFTVENKGAKGMLNYIQAALFGKWALAEARAYIDGGFKPQYNPKWTAERGRALENGISAEDFAAFHTACMTYGSTQANVYSILVGMDDITEGQKQLLWKAANAGWETTYKEYKAEHEG